jgi:hypothetical protein
VHTTLQLGTENLNAPEKEANVRVKIHEMNGTFISEMRSVKPVIARIKPITP